MNINIYTYPEDKEEIAQIVARSAADLAQVKEKVEHILAKVRKEGDRALLSFTKQFDRITLSEKELIVNQEEIQQAYAQLDTKLKKAIAQAIENIGRFAKLQMPKPWFREISPGCKAGVLIKAIEKVGCYVPGGKYPLASTALMSVIPAKVAGVKQVVVAAPAQHDARISPAIIVAADMAGADMIIKAGGSQAIASLAYGTKTIPKVDKIVGPGNIYVTAAKKSLFGELGIDMLAGPSELVVMASAGSNPRYLAADMLAQAEHDILACALLVTSSRRLARKVARELRQQVKELPTKETIKASFTRYSCIVLVSSLSQAIAFSNAFAPEHLQIIGYGRSILNKIVNAGSIFIGENSPEAAGDYCSGPNHILPTGQFVRCRAGLSVYDFLKMQTVQELTAEGLCSFIDSITALADIENLPAHAAAAKIRFPGD